MTETQQEMNLWDVCKSILRGCGRLLKLLSDLLTGMLRLTYRKWWVAACFIIAGVCVSLYYTRPHNRRYKVNAVVYLNGPSVSEAKERFEALNQNFPTNVIGSQNVSTLLGVSWEEAVALSRFRAFNVIDCLHDGTVDYIDWGGHNSGTDTTKVQMKDRLAVQFQTKDLQHIQQVTAGIMQYMNSSGQFEASYNVYKEHAARQLQFDRQQIEKLDSLTTFFYRAAEGQQIKTPSVNMAMGKREVVLFLDDIERFFRDKQLRDHRYTFCTAPVTLQGQFIADARPVNGRLKFLLIFSLIGWIAGCAVALVIEQWNAILAFLRTRPS